MMNKAEMPLFDTLVIQAEQNMVRLKSSSYWQRCTVMQSTLRSETLFFSKAFKPTVNVKSHLDHTV